MLNFSISVPHLQLFFLIFLRIGAILFTLPLFDSRQIPLVFKAGLVLSVSYLLLPQVDSAAAQLAGPLSFAVGVAGEILFGAAIGLSVRLVFAGVQLAGQLAGFQMGFSIVNVVDPVSDSQVSIVGQVKNLVAMLVFLAIDAHLWLFRAVVESFHLVPPLQFSFGEGMLEGLMQLSGNMFVIALKMGAPVMTALLLTSVALGIVARTVPQMQIFMVAMPLKIIVGMIFIGLALPYMVLYMQQLFGTMAANAVFLIRAAAG